MDVYFFRHGPAGKASQWEGDDQERPLTREGAERVRREAAALARMGLTPDLVLTSPYLRTLQTAELLAAGLSPAPEVQRDERLAPGFGIKQLGKILAKRAGLRSVVLVGHEPDFSETIGKLIGGGEVVCPQGSLAWVEVPDPKQLQGRLVALYPPNVLERWGNGLPIFRRRRGGPDSAGRGPPGGFEPASRNIAASRAGPGNPRKPLPFKRGPTGSFSLPLGPHLAHF